MSLTQTSPKARIKISHSQAILKRMRAWPETWVVAGLMLIATISRFATISKASIWHDEGFTMMLIGRNPIDIWIGSGRDVHPPLFYELLHFWTTIFGRSELAARSMSAVAGLATIYICYILVKRYFDRTSASVALVILAVAPFLIRYSQEARMYGVLGLFLILATYALLRATEKKASYKWWVIYVLAMVAGLYTHYFTALVVAAHWTYLISLDKPSLWKIGKTTWLSRDWWLANLAIVVLWLPWLPSFYGQFTRGQGIGWIPKTTPQTLPRSIWQNLTFTDAGKVPEILFWLVPLMVIGLICWVSWTQRKRHPQIKALFFYTVLPIAATIAISVIKPVYQDRYLVFAANGMYVLLGLALVQLIRRHAATGLVALSLVIAICLIGVVEVGLQARHDMRSVARSVDQQWQPGDEIVSAELYTYFDFSYYCSKCFDVRNEQVWSNQATIEIYPPPYTVLRLSTIGGRPNGYGESALLQDRAEEIYVDKLESVKPLSGRIWLIGKPGDKGYWQTIPANWSLDNSYVSESTEARVYTVR